MYKLNVTGHFEARRARVADRLLPRRYELTAEPNPDEPGPALRLIFEVRGGVPQCVGLHLDSTEHGREIRRADLRIPLEDHLEWATQAVAQPVRDIRREPGRTVFELDSTGLDVFRSGLRRVRRVAARRGPGEAELREAAEVYTRAGATPTVAVAEHFGIAHRTASLWISRARKAGYLS